MNENLGRQHFLTDNAGVFFLRTLTNADFQSRADNLCRLEKLLPFRKPDRCIRLHDSGGAFDIFGSCLYFSSHAQGAIPSIVRIRSVEINCVATKY